MACPHLKTMKDTRRLYITHLILATNIKLVRYKGRPTNKVLWTLSMDDHETIIDALQKREDADGTTE